MKQFILIFLIVLFVGCGEVDSGVDGNLLAVNNTAVPTEIPLPTDTVMATETTELLSIRDPNLPTPVPADFSGLVETPHGQMYIQCSGQGDGPVAILEAGLGNNATVWRLVERELTASARTCSYNRLVGPGPDGEDRTARLGAEELHLLLETAGIPAPYVLVGHSYGGFVIRLYTDLYPEEVAGLVFVDSSHEDQRERMNSVMTPEEREQNQSRVRPSLDGIDFDASALQVAQTVSLGDRPVMVLTRGQWQTGLSFISAETNTKMHQEWIAMHDEIAALSTNSEHRFAPESGHHIQLDEPEIVVEGILWVLAQLQTRG